eukprot:8600_1
MSSLRTTSTTEYWIHVPQSFCGRITSDDRSTHIAGILTGEFSTCCPVIIAYTTKTKTIKSLIHFDAWNNPEYMITHEVKHYQTKYPNGKCKIYIITRENEYIVANIIKTASIFEKNDVKYEIFSIPSSPDVQAIGIHNNSKEINKQSIIMIKDDEYTKIISDLSLKSDLNLLRHPDEWQLVLERKIFARIAPIDIQNTLIDRVIFNGHFWMHINQNKKLYQKIAQFLDTFTFDTPISEIADYILKTNVIPRINQCDIDPNNKYACEDHIMMGAMCTKILKGMKKSKKDKNYNYVLTEFIHENCKSLIITMNEEIPIEEIPIEEKKEMISCCEAIIKIKNIEDIHRFVSERMKIFTHYYHNLGLNTLLGSDFGCYMYQQKRQRMEKHSYEVSKVAMVYYKKKQFDRAKKLYWQVLVFALYLYCSPSHNLASAYYNYGASCQNANDRNANIWLDITYTMNKEIQQSKFDKLKNEREKKIIRRLKEMGVDTKKYM